MAIIKKCKKCGKEFTRANCLYCYECLPPGLSESTRHTAINRLERELNPIFLVCPMCNKKFELPYGEVNRKYCFECMPKGITKSEQTRRIRQVGKIKALQYLGSKCVLCGYNKYPAALEFHHINEKEKDYNLSNIIKGVELDSKVIEELDKCVILCSNCHRAYHASELNEEEINKILGAYNGN